MNLSFRTKLIAGATVILTLAVCGWCIRRDGIAIGKIGERVAETGKRVDELRPVVAAAAKAADVEVKKSLTKRTEYRAARSKVEVKGDSVFADGQRLELPSVAALVKTSDAVVVQDSTTFVKQAAKDSVNLAFYHAVDAHDAALEQAKQPWCGRKCGIVIGTAGTAAVVIIAVKIIKAVAHR